MKVSNLALLLLINTEAFTPSTTFISKRLITRSSQLYYVKPPPETLEQMLKNSPAFQTFIDEINQAEKAVAESIAAAENIARTMIAENMQQSSVASNLIQDFKAAEGLAEAAVASVVSESAAAFDLKSAAGDVVDSIKEAEAIIESVAAKILAATGGDIDASMKDALEAAAVNVRNSMEAAESVAFTIEKVASEDSEAINGLEATGTDLSKSIESAESLAESAIVDISADSNVVKSLKSAAGDVMEEMRAAEAVAGAVAKVTKADAQAVVSLEPNAKDVVDSIRAMESAIDAASTDLSGLEAFKTATATAIKNVKADEISVESVVQTVTKDSESDVSAVNALKSADSGIDELIKAAEEVAKDVFDDTLAVAALNAKTESVLESIKSVESVAAAEIAASTRAKAVESAVLNSESGSLLETSKTSEASNSVVEAVNAAIAKSVESEKSVIEEKLQISGESLKDGVEQLAQTSTKSMGEVITDKKMDALSGGLDTKVEKVVQSIETNNGDVTSAQAIFDGTESGATKMSALADSGIEDLIKAAEEVAKDMADVTAAVTSLNAKAEYVLESIKTIEAAASMKTAIGNAVQDTTAINFPKPTEPIEATLTLMDGNMDIVSESATYIEAIVSDCANCAMEAIVSTTNALL